MTKRIMTCLFLSTFAALSTSGPRLRAESPLVFISSFAAKEQAAIHAFTLDAEAGRLVPLRRTTDVEHPFFLAVSPDGRFLYSIHSGRFGGERHDEVAAFRILGRTGELELLNRVSARGTAACYLDVNPAGNTVIVANYSSGSVAAFPVQDNGSLSEAASFIQHEGSSVNPDRQKGPHAHCFVTSPDGQFALSADLGLDKVLVYRLGVGAKLTANDPPFARTPAGAGPRHLTIHPNGRSVYVINELANSVTVFDYSATSGALTERQTISTLPGDFQGTSYCADVRVTPNGRFLYGTNRGHDSIAVYSIGDGGVLTRVEIVPSLGKGPQNLRISPDGALLLCANMPGNNVALFRINEATGRLTSVGAPIEITSPSCIMLVP
jgi:6-phosphogluconolactonase